MEALKTLGVVILVSGIAVFIRGTLQNWKKKESITMFIVLVVVGFIGLYFLNL